MDSETITEANDRKIREYADCIRQGDDPEDILRIALRDILKDITASEHQERIGRINAENEVREDDGVRRLLHRRLADAEARLAAAPHDSSCLIDWAGEGDNVHHYPNAGTCDCWKAEL